MVRRDGYLALVLATISDILDVELSEVEATVGSRSFQRGRSYARANRVLRLAWDAGTATLTGSVVGNGALYDTGAFFSADDDRSLTFQDGECTCPVGYNCKHVAAIVIAAYGGGGRIASRPGGPASSRARAAPRRTQPAPAQPSSWERSLRALIETPAVRSMGDPLAIELSLQASSAVGAGPPRLLARLMREGARGGWINGSLRWDGLDSWQLRDGDYRTDHLDLVRELYAIHRVREGRASYHYGYGSEKALDLGSCESVRLWPLLEEAAQLDLPLVHARPDLGAVRCTRGELLIDVTRASAGEHAQTPVWLVNTKLQVDGTDGHSLTPLLFIGGAGHGMVCAERRSGDEAEHDAGGDAGGGGSRGERLWLVRLRRPAPVPLQRMLLDGEPPRIPAEELGRFAQELYPALRHLARVVSSDESFTPPEISPPELVLRARYGSGHAVELGWEWAYRIGEAKRHVSLSSNGPGSGFRDLDAERGILTAIDLAGTGLERFGVLDRDGRPARAQAASLAGIEGMQLTTEVLPALAELDLSVEVVGEPPDYRDVSESLTIGLATTEVAGERDWFDLGVTISVEGRELPFAEVFAALARGESQMLLDDGAHFSLLAPDLQELRRLIEEARALSDSPPEQLRISRYQAGLWAELAALGVVTEQARTWQRQVNGLLEIGELAKHDPPATLQANLRPYQQDGFGWLATLWELELGGVLADDMGLGKTLQVLALICHARERDPSVGPFLVVAPTSVVSGWCQEAARFASELKVEAVRDTFARSGHTIEQVASADVVVTTYTLFRLEIDAYRGVAWAGLILDEAQYVKNHQAKTYRCARELHTPFKLAMTGTPMENNLMELWSQLSITAPGLFPEPKRFSEQYARPIERGGDTERLQRLRRRIKPLIKRRTKELVAADLPAKQEQTLRVDLHPRHRKLYQTRSAARAPEGARVDRRPQPSPLHDPALDHAAAPAQPPRRPGGGWQGQHALRQAGHARRATRRGDRRRPPGARVQPVHRLSRQGSRTPGRREHRLLLPRRPHPAAGACD